MQREMGIKALGAIYIYFSFTQDGEVKSRCSSNQCSWYQTFQRPPQAPDPWTLTNLGFDLNNISSIWLGDEHFVFINYSWLALVILGGKTAIIGLPHRGPRTLPSSIPFTLPVTPLISSLKCVLSKKLFHSNATFFSVSDESGFWQFKKNPLVSTLKTPDAGLQRGWKRFVVCFVLFFSGNAVWSSVHQDSVTV